MALRVCRNGQPDLYVSAGHQGEPPPMEQISQRCRSRPGFRKAGLCIPQGPAVSLGIRHGQGQRIVRTSDRLVERTGRPLRYGGVVFGRNEDAHTEPTRPRREAARSIEGRGIASVDGGHLPPRRIRQGRPRFCHVQSGHLLHVRLRRNTRSLAGGRVVRGQRPSRGLVCKIPLPAVGGKRRRCVHLPREGKNSWVWRTLEKTGPGKDRKRRKLGCEAEPELASAPERTTATGMVDVSASCCIGCTRGLTGFGNERGNVLAPNTNQSIDRSIDLTTRSTGRRRNQNRIQKL
mmetsp:Transcript_63541/g.129480  ORF Transcript_63541/g.129480 Transcript_63541/m.129480 type:complete len:291 (-) Transcript_63541:828-1700(-)